MANAPDLEVTGFEEMVQALEEAPETVAPYIEQAMQRSLLLIQGGLRRIPGTTEANSPLRGKWYERNWGTRWRRKDASVGGIKTSEQLPKRWTIRTQVMANATDFEGPMVLGIVGNNASYVRYVQARDDQQSWHKRRGWPTVEGVIDEQKETIDAQFGEAVDLWVEDFNEGE